MRALPAGDRQLILAGTALGVLAYPPFHLLFPSFLALVPAVRLIGLARDDPRPVGRLLAQGFWYGALSTTAVMFGGVVALWRYSPPAVMGFLAVPVLWGVYHALLFWFAGRCSARFGFPLLVVFPVGWTALEWFVGHQPGLAFPWLGLGTSLTGYPVLIQIADLIGSRGVTFLLAVANAALAAALFDRRRRGPIIAAMVGGMAVCAGYGWYRMTTTGLVPGGRIAVVQPAATLADRADPAMNETLVERAITLTRTVATVSAVDLVVWPEAALPGGVRDHPRWVAMIDSAVAEVGAPILAGVLETGGEDAGGHGPRNAAVLYGGPGEPRQYYFKRFLVPLVERIPILARLAGDTGGFLPGTEATVFSASGGDFGVVICYESAFEQAARGYRRGGASFLVNMTNDAWLEGTTGMSQHPAHLVMRAIENRLGVVRVANTGLSFFVDPLGRIHDRIEPGVATTGTGVVMTAPGPPPGYARAGDWVGPICVGLVLVIALAYRIFPTGDRSRGA